MFPGLSGSECEVRNKESSSHSESNIHEAVTNTDATVTHAESVGDTRSSAKLLPENSKRCSGTSMDNKLSFVNSKVSSPFPTGNNVSSPEESQILEMEGITTTIQNQSSDQLLYDSTSALSNVSEGPICRICHEGEEKEDLLSPCHCSGTVGLLHLICLETWLGSSSRTKCELCGFEYTVDSKSKPFKEWILHPSSPNDRRNLICDGACFILLTPLATISSWLCLIGAQYYSYWTGRWEVPGLISLTVFLMCIYITWCLVVLRYHYHVWADWRKHNQIVRIKAVKQGNVVSRDLKESTGNNLLYSQRNSAQNPPNNRQAPAPENNNNNAARIEVDSLHEEDVVVEVSGGGAGQRNSYKLLSDSHNLLCSPHKPSLSMRSPRRNLYCTSPKSLPDSSTKLTASARRTLLLTSDGRSGFFSESAKSRLEPFVPVERRRVSLASPETESSPSPLNISLRPASAEAEFSLSPLNISLRTASISSEDADLAEPLLACTSSPIHSSRSVSRSLLHEPAFLVAPRQSLVTYRVSGSVNNACNVFSSVIQPTNDTRRYCRVINPVQETYV